MMRRFLSSSVEDSDNGEPTPGLVDKLVFCISGVICGEAGPMLLFAAPFGSSGL